MISKEDLLNRIGAGGYTHAWIPFPDSIGTAFRAVSRNHAAC